jgi:hypothetical protein
MAEKSENNFSVTGTVYSKKTVPVTGKKDPTQQYLKHFITVEVQSAGERSRGDKTMYATDTQLIVFELFNPKFDVECYNITDLIFVRFYIEGKEFTYSKGPNEGQKGVINRNIPTFVKFADLDSGRDAHKGKVTVDAMSDVKELPQRETVFVQVDPEDEGMEDLPF